MKLIKPGRDLNGFQYDRLIRYIELQLRYNKFEGEIDVSNFKDESLGFDISKLKFKIIVEGE